MFHRIKCDYIKFTGKDRLDLLHRLSTNDIKTLGEPCLPGGQTLCGKKTILTTDKGRIVDLLTIYSFPDFLFATCSPGNAPNVIRHLDKYTIMEDFKPEDMSGTHESVLVFGEGWEDVCREVFAVDLRNNSLNPPLLRGTTPFDFSIVKIGGVDLLVGRNDDEMGGFVIIFAAEKMTSPLLSSPAEAGPLLRSEKGESEVWKWIRKCGEEIDDEKYEALRIKAGAPKFGSEMGEDYNPLECNLERYVSFTKGCYIGQEVIARLDTYDKVSKHLVGIRGKERILAGSKILAAHPPNPPAGAGPPLRSDLQRGNAETECGYVTSAAGNIGLGFVRTAFLDFEKKYRIGENEVRLVNLATN